MIDSRLPEKVHASEWDLDTLESDILTQFGVKINTSQIRQMNRIEAEDNIVGLVVTRYDEKEQRVGAETLREAERFIMLNVIDTQWKDHLLSMDHLKEGIGLRGYGQKDPLIEYKKESWIIFQEMMDRIEDETVRYLFFLTVENARPVMPFAEESEYEEDDDDEAEAKAAAERELEEKRQAQATVLDFTRNIQRKKEKELAELQFVGNDGTSGTNQPIIASKKPGRNDPCHCGSGKKYKKCHGA